MPPTIIAISSFAAGFIIGAVVIDWFHTKRWPSSAKPSDEIGYPFDFRPRDLFEHRSRVE